MKLIFSICFLMCLSCASAQPNCEAYKHYGDDKKYEACRATEKAKGHYQFSKAYQEAFDEALAIDPTFAYAYQAKSTAYLKSGDFINWKRLMDNAIKYDPKESLGYRGWCRYQFFRDYTGAIADIELLDSMLNYDIGHSVNGDYHLHVARALCYKALGKPQRAIQIINEQLKDPTHALGLYDYLHLGVLYLETGDYQQAIDKLKLQEDVYDLAENRYYKAMAYKQMDDQDAYRSNLILAKEKYEKGSKLFDPYTEPMHKIYLEDINAEMEIADITN